ncbi:beta-1,3-galactosyl-O-glycosyl-glycoprotein beta-1,6-N-acetylglucosaminyltransferase, partial [Elysia marginata]
AVTIAGLLAVNEKPTQFSRKALRALRIANNDSVEAWHREMKNWSWEFEAKNTEWYLNATQDCAWFQWIRGYIMSSLSQEEADFPIAFSLLVYKDVEMVERLLRSVYRPQNFYCIHVDKKAQPKFYKAVHAVASCFPDNVRIASRQINVQW